MARIDKFITNSRVVKGVSDHVVVYDITSNSERSRINKLLKGYGFRIQKSVFECRMNKRIRSELIIRLEELEIKTGFVKIYRMEYNSKKLTFGDRITHSRDEQGDAFIV